jgi:hypothetical protein
MPMLASVKYHALLLPLIHTPPHPPVVKTFCLLLMFLPAFGVSGATPLVLPVEPMHFEGRVVQRSNGELDLFNGFFCGKFPQDQMAQVAPHLGKLVDVEFHLRRDPMALNGHSSGPIERVTVIEETVDALPIVVTIEPTKKVYTSLERITAKVTLENRSQQTQPLQLQASCTTLSRDFERVFWLEGSGSHYYPDKTYQFAGKGEPDFGELTPGGRLVFTIKSQRMAEPGKYDLSYTLHLGMEQRPCVSKFVPIEVQPPAKGNRDAVLKSWLQIADHEQRIAIANELAEKGDRDAVDAFLAQLKTGTYRNNRAAYTFAFEHGGKAGEKLAVGYIKRLDFQESVQDFVYCVFVSKNRLAVFADLLTCEHAVEINLQGWVQHPRVCDITAYILMQRTSGKDKVPFPCEGSESERTEAVNRMKQELKENPQKLERLPYERW